MFIARKDNPYLSVPKDILDNPKMSYEALGMVMILLNEEESSGRDYILSEDLHIVWNVSEEKAAEIWQEILDSGHEIFTTCGE